MNEAIFYVLLAIYCELNVISCGKASSIWKLLGSVFFSLASLIFIIKAFVVGFS